MNSAARVVMAMVFTAAVFGVYWVGGGEFERGPKVAVVIIFAIFVGAFVYTWPSWDE